MLSSKIGYASLQCDFVCPPLFALKLASFKWISSTIKLFIPDNYSGDVDDDDDNNNNKNDNYY